MMTNDIDKVIQRAHRYWYEDGLAEIATGWMFVLCGLFLLMMRLVRPGWPLACIVAVTFTSLVAFGGLAVSRAVKAVKNRITYPRTGYVSYRRPESNRRRRIAAAGVGIALWVLGIVLSIAGAPAWLVSMPMVEGLIIGAGLVYLGHRLGIARFYALAFLSALIGVMVALNGFDDALGSAAYFGQMGLVQTASGLFTLRTYLSQTQPPVEG
ncbi:MAG: hypothetical protein ACETWR_00040 [Anaerolineae bacterium]